jgi:iron complex transport system ATP-binding protein
MSSKDIISIKGLSVRQNQVSILDDINWQVKKGEHWVILGANGSGKTTLLNVLNAYMPITQGEVEVCGKQFGKFDWRELRKTIGLVSGSIGKNIYGREIPLEIVVSGRYALINYWHEVSEEDREHAYAILERVECEHIANREWRFLSEGECKRILIARALMAESRLLILDEPCAGLDPVARERFLEFINALAERDDSPSIVLVTHHVEEIMPVFSHVLILKNGDVISSGPKEKTLSSSTLSRAFDANISLKKNGLRYSMVLG